MEQLRTVWGEYGRIDYILNRKKVKNLNLRIKDGKVVMLSIPMRCTLTQADEFIISKSGWIMNHISEHRQPERVLPEPDREACRRVLTQAVDRVYPLVASHGVVRPLLKCRKMRSQWGNCHWMQGYITLNTALYHCPEYLRDYVALHELVHFLHHDHGYGFYAMMDTLMPDWKSRRKELKRYSTVIGK